MRLPPTSLTCPGSNGSILRCSAAMRRIHLSDLMVMLPFPCPSDGGHEAELANAPSSTQAAMPLERQPSAYDVRATTEYGTGLTIARISICWWRSTVGFFVPPPSSPPARPPPPAAPP